MRWLADNNVRAYLAEYDGEATDYDTSEAKFAVERCRLLRELTRDELASLNVFSEGEHTVRDGVAWAYGTATVVVINNAMAHASGNATVHAHGSATVRAHGSATVHAYDSATVHAYDSATVHAYDSATVHAHGSATVHAHDSVTVHAGGGSVCIAWYGNGLTLTREGEAVIIDRRNGAFIVNDVDMKAAK